MGAKEGLEWADEHDVAAYFLVRAADGFESYASRDFARYLEPGDPAEALASAPLAADEPEGN